jgi:O-antigen/teichoic acid export membrane protein
LFYAGLSRTIGDISLGNIILVQAAAGIVLIACVPQCWVYLLAAQSRADLEGRYRRGLTVEAGGILLGLSIVALLVSLLEGARWQGALLLYTSLAVQASSSCLGWLRATERWTPYTLWVLGPNLIRAPLAWCTPWLTATGLLPNLAGNQIATIAIYFLAPDILRWLCIALPIAVQHYRWPGLHDVLSAVRVIAKNWLFDLGSSITEVADRVVVGILLGPQTLVAYFFARRLGVVATMVCEPYYAEQFRRKAAIADSRLRNHELASTYRRGLGIALVMFAGAAGAILLVLQIPALARLIPGAVLAMLSMFFLVLLLDCLVAANRWTRFVAQLNGGSLHLLGVRIVLFAVFATGAWAIGDHWQGVGLAVALALSWVLEALYLVAMQRSGSRRTGSKSDAETT